MRTDWRIEVPQLVLISAMFLAAVISWPSAPDQISVHWDFSGRPDRFGGKLEGLFLLPALALFVYVLMLYLPKVDPGRANHTQFAGAYSTFRVAVVVLLAAVYGFTHLYYRGVELDAVMVAAILSGGLFVVLGNSMGKLRPNWFVGIRTPWTLSSRLSWTRTHRLGGRLMVFAGVALLVSGLVGAPPLGVALAFFAALVCVLFLVVYSYLVWRSDPYPVPPAGTLPADKDGEGNGAARGSKRSGVQRR